jgi:hypothetical protein
MCTNRDGISVALTRLYFSFPWSKLASNIHTCLKCSVADQKQKFRIRIQNVTDPQHCVQLLGNVKYVQTHEITLFRPENKAPFYRIFSDPVSDPYPKRLFRFLIGSG